MALYDQQKQYQQIQLLEMLLPHYYQQNKLLPSEILLNQPDRI